MVIPMLRFTSSIISFSTLDNPAAYYVVITDNIDGSVRMVLGHQAEDATTAFPQCLLLTKSAVAGEMPLLVFTDTGVRTAIIDQIADALRKKYAPLIGPDITVTQRNDGSGVTGTHSASTDQGAESIYTAAIGITE